MSSNSNSFVKDKKRLSTPMKLLKYLFSTVRSKVLNRKSRLTLSKSTPNLMSTTISSGKNHDHHHHHHHHYQTINHHHHYFYHPQPSHNNQNQSEAETSLCLDNKNHHISSSEDATSLLAQNIDDRGTPNGLGMDVEVVPQKIFDKGKHVRNISPEIEFFDDDYDDGEESLRSDSNYITVSGLQLLGVDAEAEEFINRRKEIWRLEKQKSEEEYWDMLARSA